WVPRRAPWGGLCFAMGGEIVRLLSQSADFGAVPGGPYFGRRFCFRSPREQSTPRRITPLVRLSHPCPPSDCRIKGVAVQQRLRFFLEANCEGRCSCLTRPALSSLRVTGSCGTVVVTLISEGWATATLAAIRRAF